MGTKIRIKKAERAVMLIRKTKYGEMHYMDLMDTLDLSDSAYYLLKKYMFFKFPEWVKYDKDTKMWSVVNPLDILPQKTIEVSKEIEN